VLRERKRWSFTPAELAATVAIAGVLSALFLPALARARAQTGQAASDRCPLTEWGSKARKRMKP
jgi:hypothetical protein